MAFGRLKSHRNKLQVKDTILKIVEWLHHQSLTNTIPYIIGYFGFLETHSTNHMTPLKYWTK